MALHGRYAGEQEAHGAPVSVKARYEGQCAKCAAPIHVGEPIEMIREGWAHEDCPADPHDDDVDQVLFDEYTQDVGDR